MKLWTPYAYPDPITGKHRNAEPSNNVRGSWPDGRGYQQILEEMCNAVTSTGLSLNENDNTQLSSAIKARAIKQIGRGITVALAAVQSIPNNVEAAISWPGAIFDTDGVWNPAFPSRIYIPAGTKRLRVNSQSMFEANATGSRKSRILMNGASEGYGLGADRRLAAGSGDVTVLATPGAPVDITNVAFGSLVANGSNYIQLMVTQDSGGALNVRLSNTWLAVEFFD